MDISVIIPTFKPGGYLWDNLLSLRNQTLSRECFEIILVLNGDREPYYSDIKTFLKNEFDESYNIHFLYTEMANVSNARNIGLDTAKGDYITFIDDDDYVSSSYLEELYKHATPNVISICFPYAFNDGESDVQLHYSLTDEFLKHSVKGKSSYLKVKKLFSGPCMKMIHKNIIGNRRYDERLKNGEDSIFMFLISDRMRWVDFTSKSSIYFRRFRTNSATTRKLSWGYVLSNCWMRFRLYSSIYFGDINNYSLYRYCCGILGICHIILNRIIKGKI